MKSLVVFYSRTGTTKKAAEQVAKSLKCDIEEIIDLHNRKGAIGYLKSGMHATLKRPSKIKKPIKDPSSYDLVIIGTPIWSFDVSSPVRAYIMQNKGKIKKAAFFCTMGGSGGERAFREMGHLIGKRPVAVLDMRTKEVIKDEHLGKIKSFVKRIKQIE